MKYLTITEIKILKNMFDSLDMDLAKNEEKELKKMIDKFIEEDSIMVEAQKKMIKLEDEINTSRKILLGKEDE